MYPILNKMPIRKNLIYITDNEVSKEFVKIKWFKHLKVCCVKQPMDAL